MDPQLDIYTRNPGSYARIDDEVRLAMRHTCKDCIGEPCDLDAICKRHARTAELVARVIRRTRHED